VALVAVTVGVRLASGGMELGPALFVLLLAPEAYWPLRRVGAEFHAAAEGVATFEAVHALLEQIPSNAVIPSNAGDTAATLGEPLLVTNLGVTHPGRSTPALQSTTTELPAAGVTVVTGPSGCGKSTLLAAVAGLLETSSGSMTVDGRPIGGPAWQAQVAWLPQRPAFIAGTIKDNRRIADPTATDDHLWSVLRRVALEERIRALPLGLNAQLGEDGTTLSAGERARLALARTVLADRPGPSSTNRQPTSMSSPRGSSRTRSSSSVGAAPWWSSPTGRPSSRSPTGSWLSALPRWRTPHRPLRR